MRRLDETLRRHSLQLLAIGDKKGPTRFDLPGSRFVSLEAQARLPFQLAAVLPVGHYARKNLGYLIAISEKAPCIYETDDDNAPNDHWKLRQPVARARRISAPGWCNVYRAFSDDLIWPRGLPLDCIAAAPPWSAPGVAATSDGIGALPEEQVRAPIQQGLADGSPDVDAVWRLVLDKEFTFRRGESVVLGRNVWCPFNSQTTWWWPEAFPLLYLPSYCSFRMTDIWRSFVAQRCLWELGCGVVFHAAEVVQERNAHNLMRDFSDEVSGYLGNHKIAETLEKLALKTGPDAVCDNLLACYDALVSGQFVGKQEMHLVTQWTADLGAMR